MPGVPAQTQMTAPQMTTPQMTTPQMTTPQMIPQQMIPPQQMASQQPMVWLSLDKYNALLSNTQAAAQGSYMQLPAEATQPQLQVASNQSRDASFQPFMRSIEATEKFLNEASETCELGPSLYTAYECGYCGQTKLTTAAGSGDGRVRIRCKCGGKRLDGEPRMHAMW